MKLKVLSIFLLIMTLLSPINVNAQDVDVKKAKLFSIDPNSSLTSDIAKQLKMKTGKIDVKNFKDGEIFVKLREDVTGKDCIIVSTVCEEINTNLMKLLITIDALKRNFSASVIVVVPYLEYARQDRKPADGEPMSAKLVAKLFKTAGADKIVTMDLHSDQEEGFFDIPVMNLKGLDIFVNYFKNIIKDPNDFVVVAPDIGASKRARKFAKCLGCDSAIVDKHRPKPNESEVVGLYGDVKGKKVILIDDMVDTGGTICNAARYLVAKGAKEVYACATHAVLSGNAVDNINASPIKQFVFLDTIAHTSKNKDLDKFTFLSSASMFAETILKLINI